MMTKHTPGPWVVYRAPNGKILGIGDVEGAGIADARVGMWGEEHEREANATLMAAAPDLLAALISATAEECKRDGFLPEWFNKALAAIAKAEGRE